MTADEERKVILNILMSRLDPDDKTTLNVDSSTIISLHQVIDSWLYENG